MGRQLTVYFGMQSCMMTHMDKISFFCAIRSAAANASDMLWCVGCGCGRKAFITRTSSPRNCSYETSGIVCISVIYPKRPPMRIPRWAAVHASRQPAISLFSG